MVRDAARLLDDEEEVSAGSWLLLAGTAGPPVVMVLLLAMVALGMSTIPKAKAKDGTCPAGTAIPASVDIDISTRDAINALKADYEAAAQTASVPWMLLAAIDYRENGNAPDRSALSGEPIGTTNPDSGVVTSSKRDSLDRAAEHLKAMASSVYGAALTASSGGDDIKKAVLAFNRGYIYQRADASPDRSPYVLNQYDAAHNNMTWPDVAGEPLAGQVEYGRYGAYTLFTRLGGSSVGGCGGLSDDEIVRIAQGELGKREIPDGCNCGPEIQPYLGSSGGEPWCSDFLSWLHKEAGRPFTGGVDGGWRLPAVSQVVAWHKANGEWHVRGDGDRPRPGDSVAFRDEEHIGVVEKVEAVSGSRWVVTVLEGNSSNAVSRRVYDPEEDGSINWQIDGWGR